MIRTFLVCMLVLLLTAVAPGLTTTGRVATGRPDLSRVRVIAVAPFADEASLSSQVADWGSARLSELLTRGPFQIISWSRVGDAMRQLGIRRAELISPSKTVAIGQAVGADAVITGRVVMVQSERDDNDIDDRPLGGGMITRVDVDVRVLEVNTRLNLFQDTFSCTVPLWPNHAMECIVRDVASRIRR